MIGKWPNNYVCTKEKGNGKNDTYNNILQDKKESIESINLGIYIYIYIYHWRVSIAHKFLLSAGFRADSG